MIKKYLFLNYQLFTFLLPLRFFLEAWAGLVSKISDLVMRGLCLSPISLLANCTPFNKKKNYMNFLKLKYIAHLDHSSFFTRVNWIQLSGLEQSAFLCRTIMLQLRPLKYLNSINHSKHSWLNISPWSLQLLLQDWIEKSQMTKILLFFEVIKEICIKWILQTLLLKTFEIKCLTLISPTASLGLVWFMSED